MQIHCCIVLIGLNAGTLCCIFFLVSPNADICLGGQPHGLTGRGVRGDLDEKRA